jgi:sulfite reductase beta subunit-like hemoprotein
VGALPVDQVPDALVRLVQRYRGQRLDGEEFHEWCRRLPNAELRDIITAVPSGAGA